MSNSNFKSIFIFIIYLCLAGCTAQKLPSGFVYLKDVVPSVKLELRYAGTHNFIGKPIDGYLASKCIVTDETALALAMVQSELNNKYLSLKIYDSYRPQRSVDHFVRWAKEINDTQNKTEFYPKVQKINLLKEGYIASKSGHTRGSTVDLTIIDLSDNNKELDMGSPYDFFSKQSWVSFPDITKKQQTNRMLLQQIMLKNNFRNYEQEWWHFTLINEPFPNTYFDFPIE